MSQLKITFTLGDEDLGHLRRIMQKAASAAKDQSDEEIIQGAREMAKKVREAKPPTYVLDRVAKLETIVDIVEDTDWGVPAEVRGNVLGALAYFTNPEDLIPDPIPGLGFLDDAIMIELVAQDLHHEMKGYYEFCRYRGSAEQRPWSRPAQDVLPAKLAARREVIRGKIQTAQARDRERKKRPGPFQLW
jgi:uncharacterized membrane protein YkvA (DUF1232 family)